jgi:hypothetical protein
MTASETAFAVTVKRALVAPAATNTDAGIVIAAVAVPNFKATLTPPLGAGADNATVQVEMPGVTTVAGEQETAFTENGNRLKENVAEAPLRLAVTTALATAVTAPAWTRKVALATPAGTVTVDGMATVDELLASPRKTIVGTATADDMVTVQVAVAGGPIAAGLHVSLLSWLDATVRVAVFPVAVMADDAADAAAALVIWSVVDELAVGDTLKFAVATTPLGTVFALIPQTTQLTEPVRLAQERVLPAETTADPGCRVMPDRLVLE